ncbi:hypothetical protein DYBT9275_03245 [Dyadobacter sp. CECT 9275]|uniref:Uncharacterized protein n=1 Tax=Dyadobacter helix TaxID=2822344 RepID=A0A916JE51_9BACT|nr:hypothetical protein [Dyadobacter sp. CECT 9275]CAG5003863.1 hypothetical protein DYBT9275_03245 [Dyadobacter sp. CECT 9275]
MEKVIVKILKIILASILFIAGILTSILLSPFIFFSWLSKVLNSHENLPEGEDERSLE